MPTPIPRRPHTYDPGPLTRAHNLYEDAGQTLSNEARALLSAVILDQRADVHEIRCWRYLEGDYDIECFDRSLDLVLDYEQVTDLFSAVFGHAMYLVDCIIGVCLDDEFIHFRAEDPDLPEPIGQPPRTVYDEQEDAEYRKAERDRKRRSKENP